MAKMYPKTGPKCNESYSAEPKVYRLLEEQLDDSFSVIHSIPWLSSFVSEFHGNRSPIGEIDFLILHPKLGILALEVKGGVVRHSAEGFYYSKTAIGGPQAIDPSTQLRRGIFAIQDWLKNKGKSVQIGRAFFFPDSELNASHLPPDVVCYENEAPIKLVLDINDTDRVAEKITSIMEFHKTKLSINEYSSGDIEEIVSMIIPEKTYMPCWYSRINNDNYMWLRLTEEQIDCINKAVIKDRLLITGWPGAGKTIVAIEAARRLSDDNKKVLLLTFNKLLYEKLDKELLGFNNCNVFNFHSLCRDAAIKNGEQYDSSNEWLNEGAYNSLSKACDDGFLDDYDVLIVDEGQVIKEAGWKILSSVFLNKKMIVMCDVNQAFTFEEPVSIEKLESYTSSRAYTLTKSLRLPKLVCERLKLFKEPDYSVINPREMEEDTLCEVVEKDAKHSLRSVIDDLIQDNIPHSFITVLTPPYIAVDSDLVPQGIRVESIGRFRGLEAPIIIILADKNMSDVDFFCAYSRATSRCIVILDAYDVKSGMFDSLGKALYQDRKSHIDKEVSKSLTQIQFESLPISCHPVINEAFNIVWCDEWHAYVFPQQSSETTRLLLKEYIMETATQHVYTWDVVSRMSLMKVMGDKSREEVMFLKYCHNCGLHTPHMITRNRDEVCDVCQNIANDRSKYFENRLSEANGILINPDRYGQDEKKDISPFIFSLGALRKQGCINNNLIAGLLTAATSTRKIAVSLVIVSLHLRLKRSKGDIKVTIGDVSREIYEWNNGLKDISFQSWQGYVNAAFNGLANSGCVSMGRAGERIINKNKFRSLITDID